MRRESLWDFWTFRQIPKNNLQQTSASRQSWRCASIEQPAWVLQQLQLWETRKTQSTPLQPINFGTAHHSSILLPKLVHCNRFFGPPFRSQPAGMLVYVLYGLWGWSQTAGHCSPPAASKQSAGQRQILPAAFAANPKPLPCIPPSPDSQVTLIFISTLEVQKKIEHKYGNLLPQP